MITQINLINLFKSSICTFSMAKAVRELGFTCANTYFAYDAEGNISDGGWTEQITGKKMFPAINVALAIDSLSSTSISDITQIEFYSENDIYYFKYKNDVFQSQNIVDCLLKAWIKYKIK